MAKKRKVVKRKTTGIKASQLKKLKKQIAAVNKTATSIHACAVGLGHRGGKTTAARKKFRSRTPAKRKRK